MDCNYAALSYVWGGEPFFNFTKSKTFQFRRHQSLKYHAILLQKTIADAIHGVPQIKERYLYVDLLCIVSADRN